jgi:Glycerol-3-phosphate dehydrogenase
MKVTVLGAGAYGVALTSVCFDNNVEVTLWEKFEDIAKQIEKQRFSPKLDSYILDSKIKVTSDLEMAITGADLIIVAVPTAVVRAVAKEASQYIKPEQHILLTSKGIEDGTLKFGSEIFLEHYNTNNIAVLSGGSFAIDIVKKDIAKLSLATNSEKTNACVKDIMQNDRFLLYTTKDVKGVEIFGAAKNVMAIGSGILHGSGSSDTTKTSYFIESLHNAKDLAKILGGQSDTMRSPAGMGDMYLTCNSSTSRNYSFGMLLGKKESQKKVDEYIKDTTVEGLYTLKSIKQLMKHSGANIPLFDLIQEITTHKQDINALEKYLGKENGVDIFGYQKSKSNK